MPVRKKTRRKSTRRKSTVSSKPKVTVVPKKAEIMVAAIDRKNSLLTSDLKKIFTINGLVFVSFIFLFVLNQFFGLF